MSRTVSREPRRGKKFWIDHVQRWRSSGLSKAAYCKENNLKPGNFYNWSTRSDQVVSTTPATPRSEARVPTPIQLFPVKLTLDKPRSASFVHVERAATEVALPADLSVEQIHHWLTAIHQLHV
jgi:hypothetical protein